MSESRVPRLQPPARRAVTVLTRTAAVRACLRQCGACLGGCCGAAAAASGDHIPVPAGTPAAPPLRHGQPSRTAALRARRRCTEVCVGSCAVPVPGCGGAVPLLRAVCVRAVGRRQAAWLSCRGAAATRRRCAVPAEGTGVGCGPAVAAVRCRRCCPWQCRVRVCMCQAVAATCLMVL